LLVRSLPPAFGFLWLERGLNLVFRQPQLLLSWFVFLSAIQILTPLLPLLSLVFNLLMPFFIFVSLNLCHRLAQGQQHSGIQVLKDLWNKKNLMNSLRFYLAFLALSMIIAIVVTFAFPPSELPSDPSSTEEILQLYGGTIKAVIYGLMILLALTVNAIPLMGWNQLPVWAAIKLSLKAIYINTVPCISFFGALFLVSWLMSQIPMTGNMTVNVSIQILKDTVLLALAMPALYYCYVTTFTESSPANTETETDSLS